MTRRIASASVPVFLLAFAAAGAAQGPPPDTVGTAPSVESPVNLGGRLSTGGWTRTSVEWSPTNRGSGESRGSALVPHDRIVARQLTLARARYARGPFEAVGSALFGLDLFQPDQRTSGRLQHDLRAEVREAYLGVRWRGADIRGGAQRIAWGHGDLFSPNDVINAEERRDPFLNETELRHAPTLAARVDVPVPGGMLQLVSEPLFRGDRWDVYGRNWALVQNGSPQGYRRLLGLLDEGAASGRAAGEGLLTTPRRPHGLSGAQHGLRLDLRAGRFDVTQYYHHGYHGTPAFSVARDAIAGLEAMDWTVVSPSLAATLLDPLRASGAATSSWVRRHHVGLDVATTAGPWVLHLDTAYQQPALFYDSHLNAWLSPAIETAGGLEYQTGDLGRAVLFEARYRHLRRTPPADILFVGRNSVEAASLVRWTWARVELETRTSVGLHPRAFVVRPQVGWKQAGVTLRVGTLLVGGASHTFGGWYSRNGSVYLTVRKDF